MELQVTSLKMIEALVPPNPKELDNAAEIFRCFVCLGTKSMSHPADGFSKFRVGGAASHSIAFIEKIASTAPAAPSKCPIADLVEDMESL